MLLNSLRTIQKQLVARNVSTVSSHVNTSSVLTPECLEFIDKIHNKTKSDYKFTMELRRDVENKGNYGFRTDTRAIGNYRKW